MNWHETIEFIQTDQHYRILVEKSYLSLDLEKNVRDYQKSLEFREVSRWLREHFGNKKLNILDLGSGNGISAVSFALDQHNVFSVEPDPSSIVGSGAIKELKRKFCLENLEVISTFGEKLPFGDESFDVVFARQCLHHATDLKKILKEGCRVLVKEGLFISLRDHVIFNEEDKIWFLNSHPLQKFYGGENAFTAYEYEGAYKEGGLTVIRKLKYYDSVVNFYPLEPYQLESNRLLTRLVDIFFLIHRSRKFHETIKEFLNIFVEDERLIPGRLYSYIGKKI